MWRSGKEMDVRRLMIADGSDVVRKVGKRILSGMGFLVSEAPSSLEALVRCEAELPNILIVDAGLDGADRKSVV